MLEDDLDRISRFRAVLALHHPAVTLDVHRTAPEFIDAYSCLGRVPDLICLDHDLFTDSPDDPDPGDGCDVSAFLVTRKPIAPAVIHSTNAAAADSMLYSMRDAGWDVDRIAPLGEDWIESYWFPTACEMVAAHDGRH
ncbi:cyclic-phosphate processing receiver domain-containing protein [Roseiconus lacunae]